MNIIIDATNMAHIAKHAMRGLSHGDSDTGTVFGFLTGLLRLHEQHDGARFLFAWDSRVSLRRRNFPEYKQRRRERLSERTEQEEREDFQSRIQMLLLHKDVLPRMGFRNSFLMRGYEADDLVAELALQLEPPSLMVSTDKDLLQCLRPGVELYNPVTKKTVTDRDFREEWGLEPQAWADVLAVAGCDTDGVPGVDGVGVVTAAKYLRGELKAGSKALLAIRSGLDVVERNRRLVALPYARLHEAVTMDGILNVREDHYDINEAEQVFLEYGFRSFLREPLKDAWFRFLVF